MTRRAWVRGRPSGVKAASRCLAVTDLVRLEVVRGELDDFRVDRDLDDEVTGEVAAPGRDRPGALVVAQIRWQKPADGSEAMAIAQIRWHRTAESRLSLAQITSPFPVSALAFVSDLDRQLCDP